MKRVMVLAFLLLVLLTGFYAFDQDNVAKAGTSDIISIKYYPASSIVFEDNYGSEFIKNYRYDYETGEVIKRLMPIKTIPNSQLNSTGDRISITFSNGNTSVYEMGHWGDDETSSPSYYWKNSKDEDLADMFGEHGDYEYIRIADIEPDDWQIGKNGITGTCSVKAWHYLQSLSEQQYNRDHEKVVIAKCQISIDFYVENNPVETVQLITSKNWKANWIEDSSRSEGGYYEKAKYPYENRFPYDGDELIITKKDGTKAKYRGKWDSDPCYDYQEFDFRNVDDSSDMIRVVDYSGITGYQYRGAWLGKESAFLISKSLYDSTADNSSVAIMYAGHIIEPVVKEPEADDPSQEQQDPSHGESKVPLTNVVIGQITPRAYTGSPITPEITITANGTQLKKNVDFTVEYSNNRDAGTAKAVIKGIGKYTGTLTTFFTISKAPNTVKAKARIANVKAKKLKMSKQTVKISRLVRITSAKGKVTYSANPANAKAKKALKCKNGKVQIRKGTKKGVYKVRIKVKAAGEKNYKPFSKTVISKIRVK